jgi:hypothetical protein
MTFPPLLTDIQIGLIYIFCLIDLIIMQIRLIAGMVDSLASLSGKVNTHG